MNLNTTFELSMTVNADVFHGIFTRAHQRSNQMQEGDCEYIDLSLMEKGIIVTYRDSRYKKKIRLLVNSALVVDDVTSTDKLLRKLEKRIAEYFNHKYRLNDFTLSGTNLVLDIDVGSRANVTDYLKVLQRIGRVKGFSPVDYDCFNEKDSFCLSGNSNAIDFLIYDLEKTVTGQLQDADAGRKKLESASMQSKGILRAEVRLTKSKAIRDYSETTDASSQIVELMKNRQEIFLVTFARIVPFGDFYKKDTAMEIIRNEGKDSIMRRRMLRLLTLIPEKKSLHLAQKAMGCRDADKVMIAFAEINLSPVTISKRHEVKHLKCLYDYMLDNG